MSALETLLLRDVDGTTMANSHDRFSSPHAPWRAELAARLLEERAQLADAMLARLRSRAPDTTPLVARRLVTVVAKAIETGDPDVVSHWAEAVCVSHPNHTVFDLVGAACEATLVTSEAVDDVDLSGLVVFLEIVRDRMRAALAGATLSSRAETTHHAVIESVLTLLRARDEATCIHSQATGYWCRRLAEEMGLGAATTASIVRAGMLHDIGKIGTPDRILFKAAVLDAEEWSVMRQHPVFGAEILAEIPALAPYASIVRAHHERFDGTGYPDGLRGTEIPFEARVVAVADAFHAMVSDRPYRRALSYGHAMMTLGQGRGSQWDAEIVDVMVRIAAAERSRSADAGLVPIAETFPMLETPQVQRRVV